MRANVSVIGDFNQWDGRLPYAMANTVHHGENSGYWTLFIPNIEAGALYKFEIKDHDTVIYNLQKRIPMAYKRSTAQILHLLLPMKKTTHGKMQQWLNERAQRNARNAAISIYEVHLGSWQRDENNQNYLNYRTIADKLNSLYLRYGLYSYSVNASK